MSMRLNAPVEMAWHLAQSFNERSDAADQAGVLPPEDVRELRESGYLTLSVPKEYGGLGLPLKDCVAAQLMLAQGSTSTAMVAGMHMHLFGNAGENRPWPEPLFERMCRAAARGGLFNSAASEPELGSPSRGAYFQTYAETHEDGWLVNGRKTWTTGGRHLTHLVVRLMIGTEPGAFLIPANAPGIRWEETWGSHQLSLRASDSHDLILENVHVSPANLLERGKRDERNPNAWFPTIMAAVYLGTAMAARDAVIRFALGRVPTALGKPIASLPKIQRQIGEIDVQLQAAQNLLYQAAALWTGAPGSHLHYPTVVAAKHFAVTVANQVTDQALHIAGGTSLSRELPLERHFRDVRAGLMQPPSGDSALEIIGRAAIQNLSGETT